MAVRLGQFTYKVLNFMTNRIVKPYITYLQMKNIITLLLVLFSLSASAKTDVTKLIKNPDFEINGRDGWTTNAFQIASNDHFAKRHNTNYCEIWTGSGTARDAVLHQVIADVPAGTYTMTVAAHNINQSNTDLVCSGAYIFINDKSTAFNVDNDYTVTCVVGDGEMDLGAYTRGCNGNYVCVDYFRLSYEVIYDDLAPFIAKYIKEIESIDQNDDSAEHTEVVDVLKVLKDYQTSKSTTGLADALSRARKAIRAYRYVIASSKYPYDMTEKVMNPGFEDGKENWQWSEMKPQTNKAFGSTQGNYFAEKWTWGGGVGNGYVRQVVKDLPNGRYRLTALATNQRQDNVGAAQTGAYIVGEDQMTPVSAEKQYSVEFISISGEATIGFNASNATGNWICVDDFHLYYLGSAPESELKCLQDMIKSGQTYAQKKMDAQLLSNLNAAIENAKQITGSEGMQEAAVALKAAIAAAVENIPVYEQLANAIKEAQTALGKGGALGKDEFQRTIDKAQALYNGDKLTWDQTNAMKKELTNAAFSYKIANGSGTEPKVTTHPVVISGCKAAVGRLTATGSNIIERGFCWATNPDPKVTDNHSSFYYDYGGPCYLMSDLEPSTEYWVRAYALTSTYAVGYGEPVHVMMLPAGDTQYGYGWNGDDEQNERIDNALKVATEYFNNWTAIQGFRPWCNFSAGTETANCGYGGGMSMGPGPQYQTPGTVLHELGHGVGIGTHWRYYEVPSDLHLADYTWDGERGNRVTNFFEPGKKCDGDKVHVCFGINGGGGGPIDYIRCVALYQAMYEDGLPAVGDGACPFYSFESNDSTRYFLTNGKYGMNEKFLCEAAAGKLSYRAVSDTEGMRSDDAYAWNVIYNKKTGLYYIRNVKSGKYFSFSGDGISLKDKKSPTNLEQIQLMPARINMKSNIGDKEVEVKPYWFARGNRVEWPEVLSITGASTSTVSTPTLNFTNKAFEQYWLIYDESQIASMAESNRKLSDERLTRLIEGSKTLAEAEHTEVTEGVDGTFRTGIETIEQAKDGYTTMAEINDAVTALYKNITSYLPNVTLTEPVDLSFMMDDANLQTGTSWSGIPAVSAGLFTVSNTAFEFTQQLPARMPAGTYGLLVRGFHSPGTQQKASSDFSAGNNNVSTYITFNTSSLLLKHVFEGAQDERLSEGGIERKYSGKYLPYNDAAIQAYMNHGFYDNLLPVTIRTSRDITLGMKCTKAIADDKIVIDGFHLLYFGKGVSEDVVTDIDGVECEADVEAYYSLSGTRIARPDNGAYIIKYKDGRTMKMMK